MKGFVYVVILSAILLCSVNGYSQWTVPRMVVQEVYDYGGSYPDNIIYPEEGTISFSAWIKERPDYYITEEDNTCFAGVSKNGYFSVRFNLGNIAPATGSPRDWAIGETVCIKVVHNPTGRVGYTEFVIESGGSSIIRRHELAVVLEDIVEEKEDN